LLLTSKPQKATVGLPENKPRLALLVILIAMLPLALHAQQQDNNPTDQEPSGNEQQVPSPLPEPTTTRLDTGRVIKNAISKIRWGHLSLLSLEGAALYDSNYTFASTNPPWEAGGLIKGLLLYSVRKGKTGLDFQYQPSLLVSTQGTQVNPLGHYLNFHTYRYLSPKWILNVEDTYQYAPGRGLFFGPTFVADFSKGAITQQPLLITGLNYLTNQASASVSRMVSAKTRFTLGANFGLDRVSNTDSSNGSNGTQASSFANTANTSESLGATLGLTHTFAPEHELGLAYNYTRSIFRHSLPTTQYHSLQLTYTQRVRPSVLITLMGGPSFIIEAPNASQPSRTMTTVVGSFSLLKSLGRSEIAFHADRGQTFTGVINNTYHNRADLSFSRQIGNRLRMTVIGGYLDQPSGLTNAFKAETGSGEVSYALSHSLTTYVSYVFMTASGTGIGGNRSIVLGGIRWAWNEESRP
jgi:hypothetical protein